MARLGRSGSKSQKRSPKRLILGVFIFGAIALVLAQSAPQIRTLFNPVRTTVGDQLGGNEGFNAWAWVTGQAKRERGQHAIQVEAKRPAKEKDLECRH